MHAASVQIALAAGDQLGESPVWDERTRRLLRVDIAHGLVHAWDPADSTTETTSFDGEPSAVILRTDEPGLVVALGHELLLDEPTGRSRLAAVELDRPDNRFNDCRADPQGRLLAGTMSKPHVRGDAALYRLEAGELVPVVPGTTISNGIGWSPEGDTMYFVDSLTQRIDAFDFDPGTGATFNRRPFAAVEPEDGLPDGLTVDAEGGVWLALFGGAALRRYSSDGTLDEHISLPVTNPTCPAFGGPDLDILYVTSARHKLRDPGPTEGALLALEPPVAGMPVNRYAG